MCETNKVSEIKSWLGIVLKEENIEDFSIEIVGNSEKGDGYIGDIVFVSLTPNNKSKKKYNFVLKCSKKSELLREATPVSSEFRNEIYMYDKILPEFVSFQLEKGVSDYFASFPKCYGTILTEDKEVIVLDNLKELGYTLWPKNKPLTRKHLDLVLNEYAKFHAVSVAMNDQKPDKFQKLCEGQIDVLQDYSQKMNLEDLFGNIILDISNKLQGDVDENTLREWRKLSEHNLEDNLETVDGLKVILHGDCWSNNFMFKHVDNNILLPTNVSIIDWALSSYSSPILDLSYFLFSSISKEDIVNLDEILQNYYNFFNVAVKKLGSDLETIYSKEEFFTEWKKYCKHGLILATMVYKICSADKDEEVDIADSADKGQDMTKVWEFDVKDISCLRDRSKHVVEYVVEKGLI